MSKDTIYRQAAIALADTLKDDLPDDERIADAVMARNEGILEYQTKLTMLPSAQPERKKGRWELKPDHYGFFEEIPVCSECGCTTEMRKTYNFCPNCGSDNRGEHQEDEE